MNIRVTNTKRGKYGGTMFEVLCDHCREPILNIETCDYLTPQSPNTGENLIFHAACNRKAGPAGYWTQMYKVSYLFHNLFDQYHNRHPNLTEFLATLTADETAKD